MRARPTSSRSMRAFLLRWFTVITALVVAGVVALVALEDFAFAGLVGRLAGPGAPADGPGLVLHAAGLLLGRLLPGGAAAGATAAGGAAAGGAAAETAQLALLVVLMAALVVAPIAVGALAFARLAERRIIAEQRARDAERAQFFARRNLMISDMAHDLRTPVMGISGLSQALADGIVDDEPTRQRYLHAIQTKAQRIGDLVGMLFDFVQLESEGFHLQRTAVDLPQLVLAEAAALYTDVEDAGMRLRVEVPERPVRVLADERQMTRVVANLIGNAVRHNAPGTTIVLGLNRRAGVVDVIVADDGRSIEADAEALFEPFTRDDAARSGGGSGLGLSIVKSIVEAHGYRIALLQPYGLFTKAFVVTCIVED